jgi:hypothetical protein
MGEKLIIKRCFIYRIANYKNLENILLFPHYPVCQAQENTFHLWYENGRYVRILSSTDAIPNSQRR